MPNYAMPGLDGFTTEYFKLFAGRRARAAGGARGDDGGDGGRAAEAQAGEGDGDDAVNPFLQLLTDALQESVSRPEGLPSEMSDVVISMNTMVQARRREIGQN